MLAVDSNILVYAHRAEMPLHAQSRDRLTGLAEGGVPWALPVFCIAEFVRVVTHPRVFDPPTALGVALDVIDALLGSPSARLLVPGARYAALFRSAAEQADARGNLAFDAQIAAVCLEHGATTLLSADRDFLRFEGITLAPL